MVYDNPVSERMQIIYNLFLIYWLVTYLSHISTWSLFSLKELKVLPNFGYFTEADRMLVSGNAASFAPSYVELMTLMLPFVLISTVAISLLVLRRFFSLFNLMKQKQEPFLVFGLLVIVYAVWSPILLYSEFSFVTQVDLQIDGKRFWLVTLIFVIVWPWSSIISIEALSNPHSIKFKFFNR